MAHSSSHKAVQKILLEYGSKSSLYRGFLKTWLKACEAVDISPQDFLGISSKCYLKRAAVHIILSSSSCLYNSCLQMQIFGIDRSTISARMTAFHFDRSAEKKQLVNSIKNIKL